MSVKLEDVLTDEEMRRLPEYLSSMSFPLRWGRACIRLAVEKCEKVEGIVSGAHSDGSIVWYLWKNSDGVIAPRHALLLLGDKYEPKPVKSAEERIAEALREMDACPPMQKCHHDGACRVARILRGD